MASNKDEVSALAGKGAVFKKAGEIWSGMSQEEKEPWVLKHEEHRAAFEVYRQSGGFVAPRNMSRARRKRLEKQEQSMPVSLAEIARQSKQVAEVPEIIELGLKKGEIFKVLKVAAMLRSGEIVHDGGNSDEVFGVRVKSERIQHVDESVPGTKREQAEQTRVSTVKKIRMAVAGQQLQEHHSSAPASAPRQVPAAPVQVTPGRAPASKAVTMRQPAGKPSATRSPMESVMSRLPASASAAAARSAKSETSDVFVEADQLGLTEQFAQLSTRPEILAVRADARSILAALKDCRGLVPIAERELLASMAAKKARLDQQQEAEVEGLAEEEDEGEILDEDAEEEEEEDEAEDEEGDEEDGEDGEEAEAEKGHSEQEGHADNLAERPSSRGPQIPARSVAGARALWPSKARAEAIMKRPVGGPYDC